MDPPETRYAKSGEVRIAYQVVGGGPLDLVYAPGFVSNIGYFGKCRRGRATSPGSLPFPD